MKACDNEIVEERFNINVNVFGYQNKVFPLYVSKKIKLTGIKCIINK